MLKSKSSVALCIVAGSFFLYCGESAVNKLVANDHRGDASFVNDAIAQEPCNTSCAAAPRKFTKLWEGDFSLASMTTPALAVGGYREVVLYIGADTPTPSTQGCASTLKLSERLDESTPYIEGHLTSSKDAFVTTRDVQGADIVVSGTASPIVPPNGCDGWKRHLVIAGAL